MPKLSPGKRKDGFVTRTIPAIRIMPEIIKIEYNNEYVSQEAHLIKSHIWKRMSMYSILPDPAFIIVILSFMNIAAMTMVKRGVVKINVIAPGTGINFTHAKDVIMVILPNSPIIHNIILWRIELGQKLSPIKV